MCLKEDESFGKEEWRQAYFESYSMIQDDAFTQRLKNIYKKFNITISGAKLPILYRLIQEQYREYQIRDTLFSGMGLSNIYPHFPDEVFKEKIDKSIESRDSEEKVIEILQTFAPNLNIHTQHLIRCIENDVLVKILLAWPYSEAAKLREQVLRKYAENAARKNLDISDQIIDNLETLQTIIETVGSTELLQIKLYDTVPSLAMYRAGSYLLAGVFLHGTLAINTFQLELDLNSLNNFVADTLRQDFELMWNVARPFTPDPNQHWRSDLRILFTKI